MKQAGVRDRPTAPHFALPPEVDAYKRRAAAFIEREVRPIEAKVASTHAIDPADVARLRAKARAAGFSMLNMPERYGGKDASMLLQVAIEEEAGKATNGLGFTMADRGPRDLLEVANEDQVARYVLPCIRGEGREAWAVTEPGAGSDVAAIATRAVRDGTDWVLNGEKWFVTDADVASFLVVLAWTEETQSLFLVPRHTPGLHFERYPGFMHDPYISKHGEIRLRDCRVPERDRIASGQEGAYAWFTAERLFIAARSCGTAERVIELARTWAQERVAYGHPIADYQGVQFPLADSLTELAAARLLTYHAAEELDRGDNPKIAHGKAAMAKLFASEMVARVTDRALQIFGGRGFMTEHPVNRYYREVRVDRIWEGTSEIQRLIIARGLFKRGAAPYVS
ncbi:MAG TPA: acyl-CoA dehydrogenase family protein [Candidatus Limnocylindrales bacterium]|nr:acyl-CoA dehydrogenase family protein [Candidatus Limnocylindrales bacterium]